MKTKHIIFLTAFAFFCVSCSKPKPKWYKNIKPIKLELKMVKDATDKDNLILEKKVLIRNDDIDEAGVTLNQFGHKSIHLRMTSDATRKFKNITENNIGKQIAIVLNGNIAFAPFVREPITDGNVQIMFPKSTTKKQLDDIVGGILKYKEENPNNKDSSNSDTAAAESE